MSKVSIRPFLPYRSVDLGIMRRIYETEKPDSGARLILRYAEAEGIYWIDPRVMDAFCRSSRISNFTMPLPVFWIPTSLELGHHSLICTKIKHPKTAQSLILQGFYFAKRIDADGYEMLLSWGWEGDRGGMDADGTEHYVVLDAEGEIDWLALAGGDEKLAAEFQDHSKSRAHSIWQPSNEEQYPLSGEGGAFNLDAGELRYICDLLWRIAGNLCMWVTHMPEDREVFASSKKNAHQLQDEAMRLLDSSHQREDRGDLIVASRHRQAAQKIEGYRVTLLGRKMGASLQESRSESSEGRATVRHLVGGHGKWQPHGPRQSLRKWIYITPYPRGGTSDEDPITPSIKKISSLPT